MEKFLGNWMGKDIFTEDEDVIAVIEEYERDKEKLYKARAGDSQIINDLYDKISDDSKELSTMRMVVVVETAIIGFLIIAFGVTTLG